MAKQTKKIDWNQELENSINLNRVSINAKYVWETNGRLQDIYQPLFKNILGEVTTLFTKASDKGKWSRTDAIKFGRMESLLKDIGKQLKLKDKTVKTLIANQIKGVYIDDYFELADMLNDFGLVDHVNFFRANLTQATKDILAQPVQGLSYLRRASKITASEAIQLEEQIRISQSLGEGIAATKKRINKIASIGLASSQRLANVTLMSASNNAHLEAYRRIKIVEKVKWSAALDSVTCIICGTQDQKIYPLATAPPLPTHFNCRCSWIPVIKNSEWTERGKENTPGATTRIARDPNSKGRLGKNIKLTGTTNYRDYFKLLPEAKQKAVLGLGKWELWKSNQIKLTEIAPNRKIRTLKNITQSL